MKKATVLLLVISLLSMNLFSVQGASAEETTIADTETTAADIETIITDTETTIATAENTDTTIADTAITITENTADVTSFSNAPAPIMTESDDIIIGPSDDEYETITEGDWVYYVNEDDKASIYKYNGDAETLEIPEEIGSYTVNHIFKYALEGDYRLKELTLPKTLEAMEAFALYGLSALENVHIDESNEIFESVEGVLFDEEMGSIIVYPAGRRAMSYKIPESVIYISDGCFSKCRFIEEIILPPSLNVIGKYAFAECVSLNNLDIPETVGEIWDYAFLSCVSFTDVNITDLQIAVYEGTYARCSGLKEVNIPENIQEIGYGAFWDCVNLEKVTFAENNQLTTILDYAFVNCNKLASVKLMGNSEIGEYTFGYKVNDSGMQAPMSGFRLTGQLGSKLWDYSQANEFHFTEEGEPIVVETSKALTIPPNPANTTISAAEKEKQQKTETSAVTIIICSILVIIISLAVILGLKKSKTSSQTDTDNNTNANENISENSDNDLDDNNDNDNKN